MFRTKKKRKCQCIWAMFLTCAQRNCEPAFSFFFPPWYQFCVAFVRCSWVARMKAACQTHVPLWVVRYEPYWVRLRTIWTPIDNHSRNINHLFQAVPFIFYYVLPYSIASSLSPTKGLTLLHKTRQCRRWQAQCLSYLLCHYPISIYRSVHQAFHKGCVSGSPLPRSFVW